jgi:hypothetical protein
MADQFLVHAIKAGAAPVAQHYPTEQQALHAAMQVQRTGYYDGLRIYRVSAGQPQRLIFDTTKKATAQKRQAEASIVPWRIMLISLALGLVIAVAYFWASAR